MQKLVVCFFLTVLLNNALSALHPELHPIPPKNKDIIRKYETDADGHGNYYFDVETGTKDQTTYRHKQIGYVAKKDGKKIVRVEGFYYYKVDETLWIYVSYKADEHGYVPRVRWIFTQKGQQPDVKTEYNDHHKYDDGHDGYDHHDDGYDHHDDGYDHHDG